jgi:hypothetical protein
MGRMRIQIIPHTLEGLSSHTDVLEEQAPPPAPPHQVILYSPSTCAVISAVLAERLRQPTKCGSCGSRITGPKPAPIAGDDQLYN